MSEKPLISVITTTYNRAYILRRAIESVQAQTYPYWELIILDDGSTDDTKALVASFKDPRIKYFYQENTKQVVARNNALSHAIGDWIVYLDSDNALRPEHFETMLSWINRNPKTLWGFPMGTRIKELYEDGKLVKRVDDSKDFPAEVTVKDIFHRSLHTDINGSFHSKQIISDGVRFDPKAYRIEDWDFFLALGVRYPEHFLYIPIVLYDYWQRYGTDGVVSNGNYHEWAGLFEFIYQKYKDAPLMAGQTWYPNRVNKWKKLADDFDKGLLPPYHKYYFRDK